MVTVGTPATGGERGSLVGLVVAIGLVFRHRGRCKTRASGSARKSRGTPGSRRHHNDGERWPDGCAGQPGGPTSAGTVVELVDPTGENHRLSFRREPPEGDPCRELVPNSAGQSVGHIRSLSADHEMDTSSTAQPCDPLQRGPLAGYPCPVVLILSLIHI